MKCGGTGSGSFLQSKLGGITVPLFLLLLWDLTITAVMVIGIISITIVCRLEDLKVPEKENLAMRVLEGISATTFISALVKATRCRFQGLIDGSFIHYTVAEVLPKIREQVTPLKLTIFI